MQDANKTRNWEPKRSISPEVVLAFDYFNFDVFKTSPKMSKIKPKSGGADITRKLGTKTADNPQSGA